MSSRAVRKALSAAANPAPAAGEEEDELHVDKPAKKGNMFAFLQEDDEDEAPPEDDQQEKEEAEPTSASATPSKSGGKKKKKKGKSKGASGSGAAGPAAAAASADGGDEIDRAIEEVRKQFGEVAVPAAEQHVDSGPLAPTAKVPETKLLSIERKFALADLEMRRMFGAEAMRSDAVQPRDRRRFAPAVRRLFLATPRVQWPPMLKGGLSMEIDESAPGHTLFRIMHSQSYQETEMRFFQAVNSYAHEAFNAILQTHPYHINSLLQLSEVFKINGDMQTAHDLVERAIFGIESCFHALFNPALGTCRLDYNIYENRAYFLTLFRHVGFVCQRGCWRTGLECAKFLLSLSPNDDPLGVTLLIDYLALRANEYPFLLRMHREWGPARNLNWLPNFAFSIPLVTLFQSRDGDTDTLRAQSHTMLVDALLRFPEFLLRLAEKLEARLRPDIKSHPFFAVPQTPPHNASLRAVQLLVVLYVERAHSLWRPTEVLEWLQNAAQDVIERVKANDPLVATYASWRSTHFVGLPLNIQRHVFLSDFAPTLMLLPNTANIMLYDPFPPAIRTTYDQRREAQAAAAAAEAPSLPRALLESFGFGFPEGEELRQQAMLVLERLRAMLQGPGPRVGAGVDEGAIARANAGLVRAVAGMQVVQLPYDEDEEDDLDDWEVGD